MKTLFMETTKIAPEKTATEITARLVQAKARQIVLDYDANGKATGLRFVIEVDGCQVPFGLPVRVDPVFKIMNGRRKTARISHTVADREQAERVAWRQLLRWVEAQLAMIETGMVRTEEVFLPYAIQRDGRTLFQVFQEHQFKALPAPEAR